MTMLTMAHPASLASFTLAFVKVLCHALACAWSSL